MIDFLFSSFLPWTVCTSQYAHFILRRYNFDSIHTIAHAPRHFTKARKDYTESEKIMTFWQLFRWSDHYRWPSLSTLFNAHQLTLQKRPRSTRVVLKYPPPFFLLMIACQHTTSIEAFYTKREDHTLTLQLFHCTIWYEGCFECNTMGVRCGDLCDGGCVVPDTGSSPLPTTPTTIFPTRLTTTPPN